MTQLQISDKIKKGLYQIYFEIILGMLRGLHSGFELCIVIDKPQVCLKQGNFKKVQI